MPRESVLTATMEFVDLGTGYRLTGFADFESALSAAEMLCRDGCKVAYLNETAHVRELEAREFARVLRGPGGGEYQNYHFEKREQPKPEAAESLKTAVEVLEEKSRCRAKFILVWMKARKTAKG